ncbi:hypothetical protein GOEFS_060_00020 [Gordonia effusa NBRC 100432]|uniref:Uncharacterized protein n=1 Tax=Gordonia effusa NBRC 100432 TaxID=1077974 RepID=H0R0K8_9ACTN|nr:hypothetical protein [Gordonia effusa]GAB18609.1 hypothetical protein GOEFS_060_00020 [Gordonia effusa NBRC 100432]
MKRICSASLAVLAVALFDAASLVANVGAAPIARDTVEITFTSDQQRNIAAGWIDSTNRPRTQQDPILSTFDSKAGLWSSTLTYTTRGQVAEFVVYLQTSGSRASCEVAVNGTVTTQNTVRGRRGIAVCG